MTDGAVAREPQTRLMRLGHEIGKFGAIGAVCYVVDLGIFNFLIVKVGLGPTTAKTISTVVAVTIAYFGNRHWTWRDRQRSGFRREYLMFAGVNGVGLLIQLACLDFTVYILELDGHLAQNVAANIGIAFGTLIRFWAYRRFVFPHIDEDDLPPSLDALKATTITPY